MTVCLGCVYFDPLGKHRRRQCAADRVLARIGDHEADAWFWVRPDGVATGRDNRLLTALQS